MLRFRFRLTEEEFFRYNYFTAWAAPFRKRYRMMYFLRVMLLYGAVALLYIVSTRARAVWVDAIVFLTTGTLYLLLVPGFVRISIRRRVRDLLSRPENRHILEDAEVQLSQEGILDKDTVSETRYRWDAIVRYAETADGHYLYTNTYHAIVIPKRVVRAEGLEEETERMLNRCLPLQA